MVYKLGIGLEEIPMPWKETCAMDEKKAFLAAYLEGDMKMTALCQEFGISRPTGYAMIERYQQDPESYHRESSRAPHHHPNEASRRLVQLIMKQRRKQPAWGPVTIRSVLERMYPDEIWPAASTIGAILKREGAIPAAPKRRLGAIPRSTALTEPAAVNEVWGIDYKGQFRTGDRKYCYPLTLTDRYSRFVLGCVGRRTVAEEYARPAMQKLFEAYGLPKVIRSDNGPPFATNGLAGLSRLSAWWLRLGIVAERIKPGHPEENGSHERMHGVMKAELLKTVQWDMASQQRAFNTWRKVYNEERPHHALGMRRPAELYQPSPRRMPDRDPEVSYSPQHEVRMIRQNGSIKWNSELLFISQSLVHQPVGLLQVDEGRWHVFYMGLKLGMLDERLKKVVPLLPEST